MNTDSVRDNIYANLLQVARIFLFMCVLGAKKHTLIKKVRAWNIACTAGEANQVLGSCLVPIVTYHKIQRQSCH